MQDKQRFDKVLDSLEQKLQSVDEDLKRLIVAAGYLRAMLPTRRRRRRQRCTTLRPQRRAGKVCNSYSEISRGSRHTYATLALLSSVPSKVTFEVLDHKVTQTARASNSPRTRGDVGNRAIFEVLAKCLSSYEFRRRIVRAYEGFLGLPPSIILSAMWLAGVALMGVSTLALYLFWMLLQTIA